MSKKAGSDAEFIGLLRENREAGSKSPGMILNKPPSGRGKSLDEMLSAEESPPYSATGFAETPVAGSIAKIGLHLLGDSPFQPRLRYDDDYIRELSGSLREVGQKEVITVRPTDSGFEIINGHCRTRAALLAGWSEIDARVVAADDREAEVSALVQNETRKDLTDYERARLYKRALDAGLAKTQSAVARMFGCSEGRVSQALSMLDLPESILGLLNQHPSLFGYRTAKDILDLIKRHPNEEGLVIQAVARLMDGAQTSSIKTWVEQTLSRRRGRPTLGEPVRITDAGGKLMFKAKANPRQIVVDVMPGIEPAMVHGWIVEELRRRVASQGTAAERPASETQ